MTRQAAAFTIRSQVPSVLAALIFNGAAHQMTRQGASACAVGGLCGIQQFVSNSRRFQKKSGRRFIDDLPAASVSRLRALDIITLQTTTFLVRLADVEQVVAVTLRRFPNRGSWSLFVCPTCGLRAQVLRALNGVLVCWRCCFRCGVRYRSEPAGQRRRAEQRIPKLRAMLESDKPLRLNPSTLWGKLERRTQLEAALRRCEFVVAQHGVPRKAASTVDLCNEPDYKPPKPRPLKRG
jgi:hypothetical protein